MSGPSNEHSSFSTQPLIPGIANMVDSNTIDGMHNTNPNFANAPNSSSFGAGSGPDFQFQEPESNAQRGRIGRAPIAERPSGILESTNIDPLNENSNKDDGWANVKGGPEGGHTDAKVQEGQQTSFAAGVLKLAMGKISGNEQKETEGREAVHGKK